MKYNYVELGKVIKKIIDYRGKTPKKLGGDWVDSGIRVISAKNVHAGKLDNLESIRYVNAQIYSKWMKDEIQKNDILLASEGASMGESLLWNSNEKVVLGQRIFCIRCDEDIINPYYLAMYMQTPEYRAELRNHATGTAVFGLRQTALLKTKVRYVSKEMQNVIGNLYYSINEKININAQINKNLEQQIEAILLKTIDNADTQPVRLGDYLYIKGRIGWKGLKKSEYLPVSDYRIINGESLTLSGIDWNKAGYISAERYEESPEIMLNIGDILLSKDGTIGKIGYVDKLETRASVASGIFVIRNTRQTEISTQFIYYLLKSRLFKAFIASRTEGSVIPHLYQKDFMEFEFPLPSPDDMRIFDNTTAAMFSMVFSNLSENERLIHLRDSLLPKLISGEIDVSTLNI